jgi:hypothetical protein
MVFNKKEYMKDYREKNKEKINQQKRKYNVSATGRKTKKIARWKEQGIIFYDWDLLHDIIYSLTSHCDECGVYLEGDGANGKCVDHDHTITDRDNVRNILCRSCNTKRG